MSDQATGGRVLLVDDELPILHAYGRLLRRAGYEVEVAKDGNAAAAALSRADFDVVVTDIGLPGMSGIDVLRMVRAHDPDVPVVLMTAGADLPTAIGAVEHGALRYLVKPVDPEELCRTMESGTALRRAAARQRQISGDAASAEARRGDLSRRYDEALAGLYMAWQPIIRWSTRSVFAYEALVRTTEPSLARPDHLLSAAEELGRMHALGQAIRGHVARTILGSASRGRFFVNIHPLELDDPQLVSSDDPLHAVSSQIVLEVTERAPISGGALDVTGPLERLRVLGFRVAVDDLGAGYAGLSTFVSLKPSFAKLDMSLVRGIDRDPTKQKLVASLATLCRQLGIDVIAEGVETPAERDAVVAAGCDLLQGYLFARPSAPFAVPSFDDGPDPVPVDGEKSGSRLHH